MLNFRSYILKQVPIKNTHTTHTMTVTGESSTWILQEGLGILTTLASGSRASREQRAPRTSVPGAGPAPRPRGEAVIYILSTCGYGILTQEASTGTKASLYQMSGDAGHRTVKQKRCITCGEII